MTGVTVILGFLVCAVVIVLGFLMGSLMAISKITELEAQNRVLRDAWMGLHAVEDEEDIVEAFRAQIDDLDSPDE